MRRIALAALVVIVTAAGCSGGGGGEAAGSPDPSPPETAEPVVSGKDTAACVKFEALAVDARIQFSTNEQTGRASRADVYSVITGYSDAAMDAIELAEHPRLIELLRGVRQGFEPARRALVDADTSDAFWKVYGDVLRAMSGVRQVAIWCDAQGTPIEVDLIRQ